MSSRENSINREIKVLRFNRAEAEKFLSALWFYSSAVNAWYEIRVIGERSKIIWCKSYKECLDALEKIWNSIDHHNIVSISAGVLPRESFDVEEIGENGVPRVGGRKKHIERGMWLWADYDCKKEVNIDELGEEIRESLLQQGYYIVRNEGGGLEAYVKSGEKVYYINKPTHEEVIEKINLLQQQYGLLINIVVDSGFGYHLYSKLAYDVDRSRIERLEQLYNNVLGNDPQVADLSRVMRLPGTWNTKFKHLVMPVRIVYMNLSNENDPDTIQQLLENMSRQLEEASRAEVVPAHRRRLSDREIRRIVELLKPYWFRGHRQRLEVFLSGFLWWKGVDRESFRKIIDIITAETNDEERNKRMKDIDYLWDRAERQVDNIAGKNYLIEEIERAIRDKNPTASDDDIRDEAIRVVEEIERIIRSSRFRSVLIRIPYETNTWIVNDPRRGILILKERETRDGDIVRTRKYISTWYIRKVEVIKSGSIFYYKVLLKNARTKEKLVVSGTLDEIIKKISGTHGIQRGKHLRDAISSLIAEFMHRKIAKYKRIPEAAGVYVNKNGEVIVVKNGVISKLLIPKEIDIEKAKRALELLIRIREFYDANKFDIAINWSIYAPIGYLLKKHYGIKQVYLFMHGEKQTGKTTLARIIRALYPVISSESEESFEEALSDYRLSYLMNLTTFPVIVDEIEGISAKKSLVAMIKRAATGIIARWRGDINRVYKARSSLIFTSNRREIFDDHALLERLLLIEFDYNDYVYDKPRDKLQEFKQLYNEYMQYAPYLGRVILEVIKEKFEYIKNNVVYTLIEKQDYLRLGKTLWTFVSEKLDVNPPPWTASACDLSEFEYDPGMREKEMIIDIIHDTVRELLIRLKNPVEGTVYEILQYFYERGLLPAWLHVKDNEILVKTGIINELRKRYGYDPIGGLKQMALRCGYSYGLRRIHGKATKCMIMPAEEFSYRIGVSIESDVEIRQDNEVYDEQIINLATQVDNILFNKNLKLTLENVEKVLIEDMGMDREEAYKVRDKVYSLLKHWSSGNEY